ncbi:omega-amidase chloroplastic [Phtheirospermum japonicum]|uniref:Omega-amidase chloroplastic n=1 Tax=Phtheirospermum japonicum TaxID=374723 RepID=A0A830B4D7_9LAMI|nr:omega-amidase chloroplastic [Phtheirospermum japonicum]
MAECLFFKIALCQLLVTADKEKNIAHARQVIKDAAEKGAQLILLPEIWNSPYSNDCFPVYAEDIDAGGDASPSTAMLAELSRSLKITIVGGSIPERSGDRVYNTCCVFGTDGKLKAKHRKIHLFDIDIPGKMTFKESKTLTAGETPTIVDTGICYDIRFQELAAIYAARGAHLICYPGAFNMTTGPLHWELLQRARAADCQKTVLELLAWGYVGSLNGSGSRVPKPRIYNFLSIICFNVNGYDQLAVGRKETLDLQLQVHVQQQPLGPKGCQLGLAATLEAARCRLKNKRSKKPGGWSLGLAFGTLLLHMGLQLQAHHLFSSNNQDLPAPFGHRYLYVATCSPARDTGSSYVAWGHSTLVGPFGEVLATTEHDETTVISEIDYSLIEQRRTYLPFQSQRRGDLYQLVDVQRLNVNSTG